MIDPGQPPADHEAQRQRERAAGANPVRFWRWRTGLLAIALLAVAGLFFIAEHRAYLLEWLPWLLLIACPLMHLLMHRGHGGHIEHRHRDARGAGPSRALHASRPELRK